MCTCEHLVNSRRHVHLGHALVAGGVVQANLCTALQSHPHTLTIAHHAGHTPPAVLAHGKRVLRTRTHTQKPDYCQLKTYCLRLYFVYTALGHDVIIQNNNKFRRV